MPVYETQAAGRAEFAPKQLGIFVCRYEWVAWK